MTQVVRIRIFFSVPMHIVYTALELAFRLFMLVAAMQSMGS